MKPNFFCVKEGPMERWFCDADCAAKYVKYRHMVGVSHVLKMDPLQRKMYLDGRSLDDFILNGMK